MGVTAAGSDDGLLHRVARELARVTALRALGAALSPVAAFVLAQRLDARAFGVYAIGVLLLGVGSLVSSEGIAAALLLKRDALTDEECEVSGTFLLLLGIAASAVFLVGRGFIARRYHLTDAEGQELGAMAPLFLAGPLRAMSYLRMQRALRLGEVARIEVTAGIAQQAASIALTGLTRSAWALVGGHLVGALAQTALAWRAAPGFTRLSLRWRVLRPVLAYGLQVQGLSIAAFLKDNLSPAYLGLVLGPGSVGVFTFATRYAQLPLTVLNHFAGPQLAVYARFDRGDPRLLAAVFAITRAAVLLGLALLVALTVGATAIIPAFYGAHWIAGLPVVYGLVANMAGGLLAGPLFALLQAQGRAGLALRVFAVWTAGTWALVLAQRGDDLAAVAWSHSTMTVATVLWLVRWAERHLGGALMEGYTRPCAAALGAVGAVWATRFAPGIPRVFENGWVAGVTAVTLYAALLLALERGRVVGELRWVAARVAEAIRSRRDGPATV